MTRVDVGAEFAGHRIESVIGRGGMGVVYRATDLALERIVALKVIAPEYAQDTEFRERFKRESAMAASIKHPNVIAIHRAGEEAEQLFITMDYVEGTDLKATISVRGRLDPKLAADIVAQVGAGLDAAHARGLVHRDVKPANVLLETHRDGQQAYLTDFGITKRVAQGSALTKTGLIVGTIDYLAPEQIEGAPVDARADVYALGCVLYEALTGVVPYPRETYAASVWAHMSEAVPPLLERAPGAPVALEAIVRRAMAKDPNERFLSAEEMARAVTAAVSGDAAAAAEAPPLPSEATPSREARTAGAPIKRKSRKSQLRAARDELAAQSAAEAASPPDAVAGGPPPPEPPSAASQPLAAAAEPPAAAAGRPRTAASRARRNPRALLGLAAGLIAAVIVVAVLLVAGGGEESADEAASDEVAAAATPLPAGLKWREVRDAPFRRQYAAATVVDGAVWVFGGLGVKTSSTTTKAYDPVIDSWKTGPGLPLPLHHLSAVTYEGEAVVIGGWVPRGADLTAVASDRVFALRDGSWAELPRLNEARAAAAAAVVGDEIVVTGGQADGKLVASTEVFDGERWRDVAEIPTPREHLGAASDGRYLYAVGGRALAADKNSAALERYDPEDDSWQKLPSMPTASGSLGATIVGGRLVTVGGESPTDVVNAVQAFDLRERRWSSLPRLRTPRHGVALAALADTLYAIGGATAAGHVQSTSAVEALDLGGAPASEPRAASGKWRGVGNAPFRRQYAAATVVDGAVWVFGGLGVKTSSTTTKAYDPVIDSWKTGPGLPLPLHHLSAVTYEGEAVVIGGWVPRGADLTAVASDRVFALRDGSWAELPRLNEARAAAAAAVVGDEIVVTGGQADGKLVASTEVFDGERWRDVAEIPTPREHLGAASDGRYLYAVGGRALAADKNSAALERYDPEDDSWQKLPSMPTASGSLGATIVGGRLVTVGGESPTDVVNAVQAFDLRERRWSSLPRLRTPRHGVALAALADTLYAIGGATAAGHVQSTSAVEALDLS